MGEDLVLVGDSTARCLGLQTQYTSYHALGIGNRLPLAEDLDYQTDFGGNYHQDKIPRQNACILAARIALSRGNAELIPCKNCPNSDLIDSDVMVRRLRGGE